MIKQTNLSAKYSMLSLPKSELGLNSAAKLATAKLATAEDTDYNKGGVLGGIKFVVGQAGAGALGVLEGIFDYAVGGLSKLAGNDQYARQLMDNDISGGISQRLYQEYNPDKSMQFVGNVASGIGQSLVGVATAAGAAAISGGTLAPVAISLISGSTIGLGAAGKSTAEAYKKTGELGSREFLYGGLSGLLEGGLEAATGAAGKVAGRIASPLAKTTAKTAVRQGILKTMIKDGAGEFIEESLSTFIDPYLQRGLKIDENAENATMQEILYSGMVGFTSGAILGGGSTAITNTQKTLIGDKVIKNGNAQKLVENARKTVATATENKKIQEQIKSLQATLNSYDALADKSGVKGKLLIGELSQGLAVTDMSIAVEEIKQSIIANAEQYAAIAQSAGNNITAEDLRTDKKDIATKLAIAEYAGKLTLSDEDYTSLIRQGNMAISKTNFTKWQNNLDDATAKDLTAQLGVDVKTADYNTVKVALNTYKQSQTQAQPATQPQTNNVAMPQTNTLAQANTRIMANTQATTQQMQPSGAQNIRTISAPTVKDAIQRYNTRMTEQGGRTVPIGASQSIAASDLSKGAKSGEFASQSQAAISQALRENAVSRAEIEAVNKFVQNKNVNVHYFYEKGGDDGYFLNGTLHINLASKEGVFNTAVHEYGHYLEQNFPEALNDYLKQVDKLIEVSDKYKQQDKYWRNRYKTDPRTKGMSEREIRVEVGLKISKHLIDNTSDFRDIVTKDLSIGQRLLIWFKNMFNRFRKHGLDAEARAVKNAVDALQKAIKAKTEQKVENKTDTKFSLPDTVEQDILKNYGRTFDWRETGYILKDGTRIDLSGKNDGARGGSRQVDHRDVFTIYDDGDTYGTKALVEFMGRGNVRVTPETPGVSIQKEPTAEQYKQIMDLVENIGFKERSFTVDFDNSKGETIGSLNYDGYVSARKVISDIKHYFQTGEILKQSEISKFRYSLSDTDSQGRKLTKEQAEFFKDSKVRDEQGRLLVVYHGTNEEFNVFDPKFIGMSSGDSGFFGRGFYFAYSQGEASMYGRRRIISAYLNIKNPFNFQENLDTYNGNRTLLGDAPDAMRYLNFARLFPQIAKDKKIDVVKQGSDTYVPISLQEFAKEYKKVIDTVKFTVKKVETDYGEEWVTLADKQTIKYTDYKGKDKTYTDYKYQKRFFSESDAKDKLYNAYEYLASVVYDKVDMYNFTKFILENGEQFTQAVKDKGYDGIIQSISGDEVVAFYPSQIKLTTNLNPTANEDIRYSLSDTAYKADVITNVYEEVDGKKTLVRKTFKGATITEKDGYYHIKTKDGTIKRKIGAKGTFVLNGTMETTKDKVLTSVDKELTMRERLQWNRVKAKTGEFWQSLKIAFVNEQAGIESEFKRLGVKNGEELVQFARAAKAAGEQMLFTSQFNYKGEEVGESLESILRPVLKDEKYKQDFYHYLFCKHNIDRLAQGKPVFNMTAEESQKVVDQYEKSNPEFVDMAAKVYKYLDNLLQYQVDTGMISQELADDLRKKYPHYVPTFRDIEGAKLGTGSIEGKYNLAIKSVLKTATGSDLAILPLDITIPAITMKTIQAARVNMVAKALYNAAAAKDDFTNIEITSTEKVDENILDTDLDEYKPLNNEVTFFDNGKRITMKVEKKIFAGFNAFAPDVAVYSGFENMLRAVNKGFKQLVTTYNPAFFIRNPIRDIQDAALYSKYPKQFLKNYAKAFNEIRTNSFLWRQYKAMGGFGVSLFDYNKGFSGTLNKWGLTKAEVKVFGKILQGVENANIVAEQLARFAEYISTIEAGGSIESALLNAADITVNFSRKGVIGKRLNATVMPFLNPAIQGFSKMVRTITAARSKKAIVGLLTKAILLGIVPQLLNQLMYNDDDEYKQLNDRDKENNYLIKIGGKFIKIPRGRVLSVLGGLAMRTVQTAQGEKADWGSYVKNITQQVTPVENFSRTIASPFADVANNLTWYGTAIEGRQFENIEPKKRYDESTSSIAIAMGKLLNYSPKKIHYLLDQYSGVIGDFILPATTKRAEKDFLSGNFTVDPTLQNKLSKDFYEAYDKAQYAKSNGDKTAEYQVRYLNKVKSAISDLYEQKRLIENSNLNNKEKRAETKAIQVLINEAYKTALVDLPLITSAIEATSSIDDDNIRYAEIMRLAYGAERALREYNSAVYEKAKLLNSAKIDYDTYYHAYFTIKGTEGRKDIKGNVISGTKKAEVLKYVKQLNLTTTQKQLLLYSQGYSVATNDFYGITSNAAKQSVIGYINRLAIPEEQKEALAKTCGFNFKNGRVIA